MKKKIMLVLMLALFITPLLQADLSQHNEMKADTITSYEGTWEGSIKIPGQEFEIIVDFIISEKTLDGMIDIPLQHAIDLPLNIISIEDNLIRFDIADVPGDPQFDGKLSEDMNTIEGDFTQNNSTFPFILHKKSIEEKEQESAHLQEMLQGIRTFIDTTLSQWNVPGVAVSIVKDGEILMTEGFGYSDLENNKPMTSNTLLGIGSSTKAFTAFSVGLLVDDGIIDWNTPIKTYMPDFKMYDDFATEQMTAIDLLTHRSGLPRHDMMWYGSYFTREELYERLRYLEPNEPFRYTFQYQNLMLMTAGLMVGRLSNSTWEDVVQERIFNPLGMNSTNFSVDVSQSSDDFAIPYSGSPTEEPEEISFRNISTIGPAGSINSTSTDMAQWIKMLLNKGKVNDTQLMMEGTVETILTPHMFIPGKSSNEELTYQNYGLGWFILTYRGHPFVQHGGNIDGFSTLVSLLPEDNLGIVLMVNQNGSGYPGVLNYFIIDHLLDMESVDWNERNLAKLMSFSELEEEKGEIPRIEGTKPSHDLDAYTGTYENPGYGKVEIDNDGTQLYMVYHSFASPLEHWHYDVFKPTEGVPAESNTLIEFHTNLQGNIHKLSSPLESSVASIEFVKLPPQDLFDPEYLIQFVGKYEMGVVEIRVELNKSGSLMLTYPGQPVYELIPYEGTEFIIGNLDNFRVTFIIDKNDEVTGLTFIQPNGTFDAKKVE